MLATGVVNAATFYPISGVSSSNSAEHFSLNNLIAGSGSGFDAADPHNALNGAGVGATRWVTNDPNGAGDYYGAAGAPVLIFDLGSDVSLSEISTWGYDVGNTNGAKDYSLRFATSADGTGGFGSSITYSPTFEAAFDDTTRDSEAFSQTVTARYVEMTITDNWRGFQGALAGGDRVGLGEVAFATPEPSSTALLGLGGLALILRRKK